MRLAYRTPRYPLQQLREEVDRLWGNALRTAGNGFPSVLFRNQLAANVWDRGDALQIEMELPGVKNDQIDISVTGLDLSVRVDRPDVAQEGVAYHRRERPVGSSTRVLRLPTEVNADRVEAQLRDGVLLITLPKAESAKPRKINVTGKKEE